jgi:hypothetical protein
MGRDREFRNGVYMAEYGGNCQSRAGVTMLGAVFTGNYSDGMKRSE